MIREAIATGATVEEARQAAADALGAGALDDVQFDVIELPQKKKLGMFGGSDAKVRAYIETPDEKGKGAAKSAKPAKSPAKPESAVREEAPKSKPSKPPKPAKSDKPKDAPAPQQKEPVTFADTVSDPAQFKFGKTKAAYDYLRSILDAMGLQSAGIEAREYDGGAELILTGDNLGVIIGRRGETFDAVQYLTGLAANRNEAGYFRVSVNTGDYRQKREESLKSTAARAVEFARRNEKNAALQPMNPYERRIIHAAIQEQGVMTSWSIGEGMARRVVVGPAQGEGVTVDYPSRSGGPRDRDRRPGGGYGDRGDRYDRGGRGSGGGNRFDRNRGGRGGHDRGGFVKERYAPQAPTREPRADAESTPLYGRVDRADDDKE